MTTQIDYKLGDCENRPWGRWEVIAVSDDHIIKRIIVQPGYRSSLQRHSGRNEHWIVLSGEILAIVENVNHTLCAGSHIYIPVGYVHRMQNAGSLPALMIEIQTGSLLSEDDIERIEDDFGRESE